VDPVAIGVDVGIADTDQEVRVVLADAVQGPGLVFRLLEGVSDVEVGCCAAGEQDRRERSSLDRSQQVPQLPQPRRGRQDQQ
jgi:hypothetical protein